VTIPASNTPPPPPPGGGGSSIASPATPRDPVLILILNLLLAGGVGYLLIGQRIKGIVAMLLFFGVAFPTCFAGSGLIAFVAAVDGYMQAQSLEAGRSLTQWTFFREHR
jgi:hypothetical protein